MKTKEIEYAVTRNACKLCTPLGACLAIKGVENALPLVHGSQGCSTYIRRYMISHFKEPIDIASSNFSEDTAIYGGGDNLKLSIENIRIQYEPSVIGIATTCLSETIGDDISLTLREYVAEHEEEHLPFFVPMSTPSYRGTHMDGFHTAVKKFVDVISKKGAPGEHINIFPGMLSPADLRYIKEIFFDFNLPYVMLPDYSETLDGGLWSEYHKIPKGGTPVTAIEKMGSARSSIEFGRILAAGESAGSVLEEKCSVPLHRSGLPIGITETDRFFEILSGLTGKDMPEKYQEERSRLADAYADGHKHIFGVKAIVYGEEDFVVGLASFLHEIGIVPVLCASGGKSKLLKTKLKEVIPELDELSIVVRDGVDFKEIEEGAQVFEPDIMVGNSKGYKIARALNIPLVRVGFPVHDRIGGQRILHIGYRGAQQLYDQIVNAIIERKQSASPVGYTYM